MSHDPSHWEYEIKITKKLSSNALVIRTVCNLELKSQVMELGSVCYMHNNGWYENLGRYIYVNRGFGFMLSR
jgi:hypothetical protein